MQFDGQHRHTQEPTPGLGNSNRVYVKVAESRV